MAWKVTRYTTLFEFFFACPLRPFCVRMATHLNINQPKKMHAVRFQKSQSFDFFFFIVCIKQTRKDSAAVIISCCAVSGLNFPYAYGPPYTFNILSPLFNRMERYSIKKKKENRWEAPLLGLAKWILNKVTKTY